MSEDDFVPYHAADPDDVARFQAIPESERGGFRIRLDERFPEEAAMVKLLRSDKRILLVRFEEGRWYTNGEDGPPWYQYHIGCRKSDENALIKDIEQRIIKNLGGKVNGLISFEDE